MVKENGRADWANIISAVKSPLGFFALVVLVSEVVLGIIAHKATGTDFTILLVCMVGVVFALVVIVAIRAKSLVVDQSKSTSTISTDLSVEGKLEEQNVNQYEVFLSSPMASIATDEEYVRQRLEVKKVFDALKVNCGFKVYWAAEHCKSKKDFDAMDASVENDLNALKSSKYFVMIYPEMILTSAIFEAGYALALDKFSIYFVRSPKDLPWLMKKASDVFPAVRVHDESEWKTHGDIVRLIEINKNKLFHHLSGHLQNHV